MKVLQIHNAYAGSRGGEDEVVEQEAQLLTAGGHTVRQHIVTNPDRGPGAVASFAAAPWNPRAAKRVGAELAEFEPDVVHAHNLWFALSPAVLRTISASGTRLVSTVHNYRLLCLNGYLYRDGGVCEDCVGHLPWRGVVHRCYRGSAPASAMSAATIALNRGLRTWRRSVDVFTTPSRFTAERLSLAGLPADRVVVKPNFVPDPGPRSVPAERSRTLLYVGRLEPEKGIADVVEAWRRQPPSGLELTICGDGSLREELARELPPGVELAGWVPRERVRTLMLEARAVLFPSRWYEGQPLAALEALAAGSPLLASDLGAGGELARPLGRHWVTPAGDVDGWVGGLARLRDDSSVQSASKAARTEFEHRYNAPRALEALETIYGGGIHRPEHVD